MREKHSLKGDYKKTKVTTVRVCPSLVDDVKERLKKSPQNILDEYYDSVIPYLEETKEEESWSDL